MKKLLFILLVLIWVPLMAQQPSKSNYEKWIDSLYQINLKIEAEYLEKLKIDSTAVRPEPAVWFMDLNGNIYNYPPYVENEAILKERELYQKKLDSLNGKQFAKFHKK